MALYHNSDHRGLLRTLNAGERVDIPCSMATPGGSVQWILNSKPILLDLSANQRRHWNISKDGQTTSLTISRLTKADEGLWECVELDSGGNVRQKAPIMRIVLSNTPEEPYLEYEGRRVSSSSSSSSANSITIREHVLAQLHCVIKGQSSAIRSVAWYVGSENMTTHSRLLMEYSAEEDTSLTISVLTLNITAEYHGQPVYCVIAHQNWPREATLSASLNVLYAPLFSITREPGFGYPIVEGMPLSLRCEIDSNPPAEARWERDADPALLATTTNSNNGQQQQGQSTLPPPIPPTAPDGSLNFSAISRADAGWYRCTTVHEFGTFASFGYFLNVKSREEGLDLPQPVDILGGEHPQLSEHNQESLLASSKEAALRKQQQQQQQQNNRGETFEASVQRPYSDGSFGGGDNFNGGHRSRNNCPPAAGPPAPENGRPLIESINSTVIALVGSQISLIARFCCNPRPKKVYWIHRHLAMMPSRIIGRYITRELIMSSNSIHCFTSSFIIDSVKPEDAGDVMFLVLNTKGVDQALISVNVTYSAGYSLAPNTSSSATTRPPSLAMLLSLTVLINYYLLRAAIASRGRRPHGLFFFFLV
ncbi:hypothetical protein TYRP_006960 [Tyrophagus putrescentiae]|nr:hypothetical protein TYRP_006960 [Tyrophagus putrescentiae]